LAWALDSKKCPFEAGIASGSARDTSLAVMKLKVDRVDTTLKR
jgi:hypothetical protein